MESAKIERSDDFWVPETWLRSLGMVNRFNQQTINERLLKFFEAQRLESTALLSLIYQKERDLRAFVLTGFVRTMRKAVLIHDLGHCTLRLRDDLGSSFSPPLMVNLYKGLRFSEHSAVPFVNLWNSEVSLNEFISRDLCKLSPFSKFIGVAEQLHSEFQKHTKEHIRGIGRFIWTLFTKIFRNHSKRFPRLVAEFFASEEREREQLWPILMAFKNG
jgi:hypothetical protein